MNKISFFYLLVIVMLILIHVHLTHLLDLMFLGVVAGVLFRYICLIQHIHCYFQEQSTRNKFKDFF
jgi:hypothetical protein